jgi:hypothetical protein
VSSVATGLTPADLIPFPFQRAVFKRVWRSGGDGCDYELFDVHDERNTVIWDEELPIGHVYDHTLDILYTIDEFVTRRLPEIAKRQRELEAERQCKRELEFWANGIWMLTPEERLRRVADDRIRAALEVPETGPGFEERRMRRAMVARRFRGVRAL